MEIRAVLFDKDGTLIDFSATFDAATGLVLDEICQGDKEQMKKAAEAIGYDIQKMKVLPNSPVVAGTSVDIAQALSTVMTINDVVEFASGLDEMFGEICINTVAPIKGVEKALEALHDDGVMMGVATNDIEANAVEQMEILELDHLFEHIIGADSGYGAKPMTGMLDAFVNAIGLNPYQVMMVGDSLHDLEAGVAAGMVTVGVETGPASREDLEEHADFVIASVADLPNLIMQN